MLQTPQDIVVFFDGKPYILGSDLREVYIKFQKKIVEKLLKLGKKHKRLDFL